jgi:hypothetical protein
MKIVKGGSWRTALDQAKCQSSEKFKAGEAMDDLGFRCVLPFLLPVEGKAEPTTRKGP